MSGRTQAYDATAAAFQERSPERSAAPGVAQVMPHQSHDAQYNRDQDQKPGRPQRSASEPAGGGRSSQSAKTMTDPASGEQRRSSPAPNQAKTDQVEGAKAPGRRTRRRP
jgi:hypothetical protein